MKNMRVIAFAAAALALAGCDDNKEASKPAPVSSAKPVAPPPAPSGPIVINRDAAGNYKFVRQVNAQGVATISAYSDASQTTELAAIANGSWVVMDTVPAFSQRNGLVPAYLLSKDAQGNVIIPSQPSWIAESRLSNTVAIPIRDAEGSIPKQNLDPSDPNYGEKLAKLLDFRNSQFQVILAAADANGTMTVAPVPTPPVAKAAPVPDAPHFFEVVMPTTITKSLSPSSTGPGQMAYLEPGTMLELVEPPQKGSDHIHVKIRKQPAGQKTAPSVTDGYVVKGGNLREIEVEIVKEPAPAGNKTPPAKPPRPTGKPPAGGKGPVHSASWTARLQPRLS